MTAFNPRNVSLAIISMLLLLVSLSSQSTDIKEFWPNSQYNQNIPTVKQVLGYELGERITNHSDMMRYFQALKASAPNKVALIEYARSWENRALVYVAIGEEKHISQLDEFAKNMQLLSDPRKTSYEAAKKIIKKMPASVWLEYGVHGNEISSTDAAMMTAYHLLAAPNEETNKTILENSIVFIDPLQNPDGRERFTSRYYATVGLVHSNDRLSAEHNEPWPSGRSNHYLFDLNRDWLAITQPETAGRIKMLNHYRPLVVVDLHEMGGDSSYYFAPSARPVNPHMTATQVSNINAVGKNNAKHFDRMGFDYFTREVFDAFYPGYGDSWPTFYGAAASTYEVASARGERFKKRTGEEYTYKDSVHRHFVASISTAESTAHNREKLLNDYYQYQVSAIKQGKSNEERSYILPNTRDKAGNRRLASLMAQHGVEVKQATQTFRACGVNYQPGAYYIDTAQPRGRFVTTTFTKQVDMAKDFIKEQERRRHNNLGDEIYDVTGWSLPLMFNIDTNSCDEEVNTDHRVVQANDKFEASFTDVAGSIAYIAPWGDMAAARFLTAALQQGLSVKSADKAFVLDGKQQYPAGSLIIEKHLNNKKLASTIAQLVSQTGAKVDAVNTSWVTKGPSFGSNDMVKMSAPNIAIAWDEPVSSLSAGNTRFVIEQQFNYPVTAIRSGVLASADLSNYQVIILPSGRYNNALGTGGAKNLKQWVNQGGVLITLGQATRFAASADIGLLELKRELAFKTKEQTELARSDKDKKASTIKGTLIHSKKDLLKHIETVKESPDFVAGVLANIEVEQEHWLSAGLHKSVVGPAYGNNIYAPIKLASGKNIAWFADKDNVLASGYLWKENAEQLAYKPFLVHQPQGKGMVIGFTQDPTTRAYFDGLQVMLMNTIFRGAAHARPLK